MPFPERLAWEAWCWALRTARACARRMSRARPSVGSDSCCIKDPLKHLWGNVAQVDFQVTSSQDRFSWSPKWSSCNQALSVWWLCRHHPHPTRRGKSWGTTRAWPGSTRTTSAPVPLASVVCYTHLKGGGKEEQRVCDQLTVLQSLPCFIYGVKRPSLECPQKSLPPILSCLTGYREKDGIIIWV